MATLVAGVVFQRYVRGEEADQQAAPGVPADREGRAAGAQLLLHGLHHVRARPHPDGPPREGKDARHEHVDALRECSLPVLSTFCSVIFIQSQCGSVMLSHPLVAPPCNHVIA